MLPRSGSSSGSGGPLPRGLTTGSNPPFHRSFDVGSPPKSMPPPPPSNHGILMTIILTHTPSPVHSTVPELLALVHLPVIDMIPVPLPFRHPHLLHDPALPQCPACLQCVDRSQ